MLALTCVAALLFPQSPTDLAKEIDAFVAPFVAADHLSGTLLVARGDDVVYEKSWGFANREHDVPIGPGTRFCIASVSKPITVALAIQLIQDGKLGVGDKLEKWVEGFPSGDAITVAHLLNHRAGIPHRVLSEEQQTVPRTAAEMVEFAKSKELLFEPGAKSVYSSAGFSVLARVLELASERSYGALLRERICEPLDLDDTMHVDRTVILPRRASSYRLGANGLRNTKLQDESFLVGAGSIWSTPRDLFRLQRAIVGDELGASVKANTLRATGFRWNGVTHGYRTFADFHRESGVTVILCTNVMTGAGDAVRSSVPKIVAGEEVATPAPPQVTRVAVEAAVLESYRGTYEMRPGSTLDVRPGDGVLLANDWVLVPTAPTSFFSPQDYATVEVVFDDQGRPEGLDWKHPSGTSRMPRVAK